MIQEEDNLKRHSWKDVRSYHSRMHWRWNSCLQLVNYKTKNRIHFQERHSFTTKTHKNKTHSLQEHRVYGHHNKYLIKYVTVEGSLSQNASRHMLQASSQASCTPPSTKAAADVIWFSEFFTSSIPSTFKRQNPTVLRK